MSCFMPIIYMIEQEKGYHTEADIHFTLIEQMNHTAEMHQSIKGIFP